MRLNSIAILLLAAGLAAVSGCSHGGPAADTLGASPPPFAAGDLTGDWIGTLTPDDPAALRRVFYVRIDAASHPYEAAESQGAEWEAGSAVSAAQLSRAGVVQIRLEQTTGTLLELLLDGRMGRARAAIRGTYSLLQAGLPLESGDFELRLSSGPGHFQVAVQLAGTWAGDGVNVIGNWKPIDLVLDAGGTVLSGRLHDHQFISGGVNTGVFVFADDAIGRLENVTIESLDGAVSTLYFALVNDAGDLLGGPGIDSTLGEGIARLERQP